jgi:predicted anti-sigma-YlaC factor YlaD
MDCEKFRDAISAATDGEDPGVPANELRRHLRRCPTCRAYAEHVEQLRAVTPIALPQPIAVGTAAIRLGLVVVAGLQLALAIPGLLGTDEGAPIHVAHEAGSWSLALAVGFLFAAWRPLRAVGLLPLVSALSAALVLTAGLDLVHGRAVPIDESAHLLEVVGTGLLWLLVHPRARSQLAAV